VCLCVLVWSQVQANEKKRCRAPGEVTKAAMHAADPHHWVWEATDDDKEQLLKRERKQRRCAAYRRKEAQAARKAAEAEAEAELRVVRERAAVFKEAAEVGARLVQEQGRV
jgi:hypothetical protein